MTPRAISRIRPLPRIRHVAVGVFDGVHRGHQAVVKAARHAADSARATAVVTFDPHPLQVVNPAKTPPQLLSLNERVHRLQKAGADTVVVLRFDRSLRQLSAIGFVRHLRRIFPGLKSIAVGYDWAFGRNRKGTYDLLIEEGARHGFTTHTVPPLLIGGKPVSSTRIREAIREGDFRTAGRLLGFPFAIESLVQKGDRRGRILGFPTANLATGNQVLPPSGIYAVWGRIGEKWHAAVMNVGVNPTFGSLRHPRCEVHFLKFRENLYGRSLRVIPIRKIREEQKFKSVSKLVLQIAKDAVDARRILNRAPTPQK